jgi:hypothetical protein
MNRIPLSYVFSVCCLLAAVPSPTNAQQTAISEHEVSVWRALTEEPLQLALSVKNPFVQGTVLAGQPIEVHVGVGNVAALEAMNLSSERKAAIKARGVDLDKVTRVPLSSGPGDWTQHVRVLIGHSTNSELSSSPVALTPIRGGPQDEVDINGVTARGFIALPPASNLGPGTYVVWASLPLQTGNASTETSLSSAPVALIVKAPETDDEVAWVLAEQAREQAQKGSLKEAEVLYRKALQKSPTLQRGPALGEGRRMFNLHAELADLYEQMGRFDEALAEIDNYAKCIAELPDQFRNELLDKVAKTRSRLESRKTPDQKE